MVRIIGGPSIIALLCFDMASPMQPHLEGGDRIINEQIKGALHATSSAATINRSVASHHSSSTYTFQNKSHYGFPTNTHPHHLPAQHDNYDYTTGGYANFYGEFTSLPIPRQWYPPLSSSFL